MDAGVNALVVAADEHEAQFGCQLQREVVVENAPERGQQNDWAALRRHLDDRLGRLEDGLGFEDHARAPAVGVVVSDLVASLGPLADIVGVNGNDAGLDGPLDDGLIEGAAKHGWKESEDIDAHAHPILPHIEVGARSQESGAQT